MTTLYRCQAVFKHQDGLPADNFSNTFWFTSPDAPSEVEAEVVAEAVRDFYVTDVPGSNGPLQRYFADAVANLNHEVRVSPIDIATGRDTRGDDQPPLWVEHFDLLGRVEPDSFFPSEVSVCLSFRNNSDLATPIARRRGRIYFGPIQAYGTLIEADGAPRVDAALQTDLRLNGVALKNKPGVNWVIYSRPFAGRGVVVRENKPDLPALPARIGSVHDVEQVWTDNAFDTQRRRGEKATSRTYAA